MSKRFEVFRKGSDGDARDIRKYETAVGRLIDKLPAGDKYEWKKRGDLTWRTAASKPKLKETLLAKRLQVGEAFLARREGGDAVFVLRAIEVITVPDCPVANPTPAIAALWDRTYAAFKRLDGAFDFVYMGGFVCRRIDGSSTWSQHAFHNAFDFRIRKADAPDMSIDTAATTRVVNEVDSYAAEALWQTSGHYFHAHLTGDPKRFGTPECA
jgi:hypothetical protein